MQKDEQPTTPVPVARPITLDPADRPLLVGAARYVHPMLLPTLTAKQAWADVGLFLVTFIPAFFLPEIILLTAMLSLFPDLDADALNEFLLPMTLVRVAVAVVIVRFLVRRRGLTAASVGLTSSNRAIDFAAAILTLIAAGILAEVAGLIVQLLKPEMLEGAMENENILRGLVGGLSDWQVVLLFVMVGFYEELVFRGFLMTRLRRATGGWVWAVLLSIIVFVPPHMFDQTAVAMIPITILALVLSAVTIIRKSLYPAILAHIMFNTAVMFALRYLF